MLIFPIAFLALLIWGLRDEDLDWKEAILWTVIFTPLFCCAVFWTKAQMACVLATVILVVALIYRVIGSDIVVR